MSEEHANGASQGTASQAEETARAQEATENTEQGNTEQAEQQTEGVREAQSVGELPEWAQKEIKDAREEAAKARKARNHAQKSGQTELQTVSQERDTLKEENEKLTRQVRRSSFIETVSLPNARAAWGYVLDGTVEVEYDENNRPKNLDAVRKALREADSGLFGSGSADGGKTTVTNSFSGKPGKDRLVHAYDSN